MDLQLGGRSAVVTGGASGIGWHVAQTLLREGATVVISDRDEAALRDACARVDGAAVAIAADVTDPAQVARLRAQAVEAIGPPQILVHAAGVTGATGLFHEIDEAGWRETFDVDFFGAVETVRAFLPDLRACGDGRLVLIASEDAEQPYVDELPYCASKAAILSLVKGLSKTYGGDGLLVNAVSPAFIATAMTDAMMDKRAKEQGTDRSEAIETFLDEERPGMVLKRRGRPEEVADVVAFLCSARASFVTGSNYRVDSGSVSTI